MFTKEDHINYFKELEDYLRKVLVVYTDLIVELSNQSIKSEMHAMSAEDMATFKFINEEKAKLMR